MKNVATRFARKILNEQWIDYPMSVERSKFRFNSIMIFHPTQSLVLTLCIHCMVTEYFRPVSEILHPILLPHFLRICFLVK